MTIKIKTKALEGIISRQVKEMVAEPSCARTSFVIHQQGGLQQGGLQVMVVITTRDVDEMGHGVYAPYANAPDEDNTSDGIKRIDPEGCACADCEIGDVSKPLDQATNGEIGRMRRGLIEDATGGDWDWVRAEEEDTPPAKQTLCLKEDKDGWWRAEADSDILLLHHFISKGPAALHNISARVRPPDLREVRAIAALHDCELVLTHRVDETPTMPGTFGDGEQDA